jgi:hypothetical protein
MTTLLLAVLAAAALTAPGGDAACISCHDRLSPDAVAGWQLSRHARSGVGCIHCHGEAHVAEGDASVAYFPSPALCGECHRAEHAGWRSGKHARAWTAVKSVPGLRHASAPATGAELECVRCHRVGLEDQEDIRPLRLAGSNRVAACASCHEGHAFSAIDARQPTACAKCHGGPSHPQWDAWAGSPHGARWVMRAGRSDAAGVAPPTCQFCHFRAGGHAQRTPYGSIGLPLVPPSDPAWAADRAVILRALGVSTADGAEGPRREAFTRARIGPEDRMSLQRDRAALVEACRDCHAARFVREALAAREAALKSCDHLTAEAIRDVATLHSEGVLAPTANGAFPDLVTARGGLPVERRLAEMVFDHRARLVAAAFHVNPSAAAWHAALARDREDVRRLVSGYLLRPPAPPRR